ncbi:MAG: hypothetical protein AAGJ78_04740 [Pseudomonadota bacterium]
MDTSELIIDYTESDFAEAIRDLLPKGEYWQDVENKTLTNMIDGMAQDFKTTHDEVELSLLTDFEGDLFGWKISDYQAFLIFVAGTSSGVVSDDITTPNLIYVSLDETARSNSQQAWQAFENKRLPHTKINWNYNYQVNYHHQIANCRHIRNSHKYEVT